MWIRHKKRNKSLWILVIILLIAGFIWANDSGYINFSKTSDKEFRLDVLKNPEKYLGQDITLKSATVINSFMSGPIILENKEDGNNIEMSISYSEGFSPFCTLYDLEGQIKKSGTGYYFEAKEVVCLKKYNS